MNEHEEAITKLKTSLVAAIMKEEAEVAALKEVRVKIIDKVLSDLPSMLKNARYDSEMAIYLWNQYAAGIPNNEYKLFVRELDKVLSDLQLLPKRSDNDNTISISKARLINLVDAKKLASLL